MFHKILSKVPQHAFLDFVAKLKIETETELEIVSGARISWWRSLFMFGVKSYYREA